MAIFTVSVATGADDGWYTSEDSLNSNSTLFLGGPAGYKSYARFALSVPQGAIITSAVLTLTSAAISTNPVPVTIRCEASDNATQPAISSTDAYNRPKTVASTSWSLSTSGLPVAYASPNFASSIQEVVDRPGWASGNAVIVYLEAFTSGSAQSFYSYDGNISYAPKLDIEYTPPVTITKEIGSSIDDGYSQKNYGDNYQSVTVSMGASPDYGDLPYLRFTNITVPQGASIISADLELIGYTSNAQALDVNIAAHDVDNSEPRTGVQDMEYRLRTSVKVPWSVPDFSTDVNYKTPDIKTVIQSIINRAGWASGNALTLFLDRVTGAGSRSFRAIDAGPGNGAKLSITYTTAAAPPATYSGSLALSGSGTLSGSGIFDINNLPSAPTGVSATNAALGDPVTVSWTPSDPDGDPQAAAKIRYKKTTDVTWIEPAPITGTATSTTIQGTSGYSDLVLARSPVLYYKFDEASGNPQDSSGNGYHGTNAGTITSGVAGELGSAVQYAGGRTIIPSSGAISSGSALSVEFRAKKTIANEEHVVFRWASAVERIFSAHIAWSDGTVYFDAGTGASAGAYDRINKASTGLTLTNWNHYVFVKNAATGFMGIYVNGTLWHSGTGKSQNIGTPTSGTIGSYADGSYAMDGLVDEFVVYNYALSATEVADSYNARLTQSSPLEEGSYEVQVATADQEGYGPWSTSAFFTVGSISSYTGTLDLSGSGSLAASGITPNLFGTLNLSGLGTLTLLQAAPIEVSGQLNTSGSGLLTVQPRAATSGSLSLAGSGSLALSGSAVEAASGALSLSGSGSLAATGAATQQASGALTLTGSGQLTTQGKAATSGSLNLSGSGSLALQPQAVTYGSLDLSGSGSLALSGVATEQASGALSLSGSGSLILQPQITATGSLDLSGSGQLIASGSSEETTSGSLNLSGSGSLATAGRLVASSTISLTGAGTLAYAASVAQRATVALTGSGLLTSTSTITSRGQVNLTGSGILTTIIRPATTGTASLSGLGTLSTQTRPATAAQLALTGGSLLELTGYGIQEQYFTGWGIPIM